MKSYTGLKNRNPASPRQPLEDYPKDAIKKLAVLFTDIVGSSKYFKAHGDIAGRKMLKKHQNLASPAINEHGGAVVKMLGDSVMAYFFDPREALKSAIRIQKRFQDYNKNKAPKERIHIRIGIHYGNGIVEERDIFGDVVNMAAKFLPMVGGDEIFISQTVYDQVRDLSSLRFRLVDTKSKKDLLKGLDIHRVMWDEAVNLDPVMKTLVYMKPLQELAKASFMTLWADLFSQKNHTLWAGRVENKSTQSDKSILFILHDPKSAVSLARDTREFFRKNLGKEGSGLLPVQIVIDMGPFVRAGKLVLDDFSVGWEHIDPGEIYLSSVVYNTVKNGNSMAVQGTPDTAGSGWFYKLVLNGTEEADAPIFTYQGALTQGDKSPCFYCGDRKHLSLNCPSKQLPEVTRGLQKLGYLPLAEINRLFFNYLTHGNAGKKPQPAQQDLAGQSAQWAFHTFFELKMVYQLRFLRTIWNSQSENWNKIKQEEDAWEKGGLIWLGQDCIRVSNLQQAESTLEDALKRHPQDFRVHCAMGFLYTEMNKLLEAKRYMKKALDCAKTRPQKMFALFLLSRLYDLTDDPMRAADCIRKILHLDSFCPEALYQDILFRFRRGKKDDALQRLTKLIHDHREAFVQALIDPELAHSSDVIHPALKKILKQAENEAADMTLKAREEVERLGKLLGEDDSEVKRIRSYWQRIEKLQQGSGYFSYLDIIHYGTTIIGISRKSNENRKRKLLRALNALEPRVERCIRFIKNYRYPQLIGSLSARLKAIESHTIQSRDVIMANDAEKYKAALAGIEKGASQLAGVEKKISRLDNIRKVLTFSIGLLKKLVIFQSANVLIALLLFPIVGHYLNFLLPGIRITPQNLWAYQKGVLFIGGFCGLVLSILGSSRHLSN